MSQLIVRQIEPALVEHLKLRAAAEGVSAEELHRRLLRDALAPGATVAAPSASFSEFLLSFPADDAGDEPFSRSRDLPRRPEF